MKGKGGCFLYLNFLPFFEFVIGHIALYAPSSKCQKPTKRQIDCTNFFHLYLHPSLIKNPSLIKRRIFFCFYTPISYNPPTTTSLALSIMDESIEARYICVVVTESCPSASEMTLTGTFFDLATVAQVWRVT